MSPVIPQRGAVAITYHADLPLPMTSVEEQSAFRYVESKEGKDNHTRRSEPKVSNQTRFVIANSFATYSMLDSGSRQVLQATVLGKWFSALIGNTIRSTVRSLLRP